MALNSEGIYEYDGSELGAPGPDFMALLTDSVTATAADIRADLAAFDALTEGAWVAISTYGTAITPDTNIPPRLRRVGNRVDITGVVSVGTGYAEANILTIPSGYRLGGAAPSTMIGAGVTSAGKSYQLYMLKSDARVRIIWRSAAPAASEQLAIVGFWYVD